MIYINIENKKGCGNLYIHKILGNTSGKYKLLECKHDLLSFKAVEFKEFW